MTREEVLQSISLKKRFAKDMNIPVTIFDNPYFLQRLWIINLLHDCVEQFESFCSEMEGFRDADEYFAFYNEVKEDIIQQLRSNKAFVEFNTRPFPQIDSFKKQNLYAQTNDGKLFVSIDLKQANFSIMRMFDRRIFDNEPTWKSYVAMFTESEHIQNSKYIRQVILGACNPGHQIQAQRYYMGILAGDIAGKLPNVNIYSVNVDEILIEVDEASDFDMRQLVDVIDKSFLGSCVKVQRFYLRKLKGIDGYYKRPIDGDIEIKGVNGELYHQVVKYLFKQPIVEDDLVFYHDGRLAKFLKPIDDPWVIE